MSDHKIFLKKASMTCQMENFDAILKVKKSICTIYLDKSIPSSSNNDKVYGFLAKVHYYLSDTNKEIINVLIANEHIVSKGMKELVFSYNQNNVSKQIKLTKNRLLIDAFSEDFTIIEIFEDEIDDKYFVELDDSFKTNSLNYYTKKAITLFQNINNTDYSLNTVNSTITEHNENKYFLYQTDAEPESGLPIILEESSKVIGLTTRRTKSQEPKSALFIGHILNKIHTIKKADSEGNILLEAKYTDKKLNGTGIYYYPTGTQFEGAWENGQRVGRVKYTHYSGFAYEGDFQGDKPNGTGAMLYADGRKYQGDFVEGQRCGKGTMLYPDGSAFQGEYIDGKPNGKGIRTFANGTKLVGKFVDGRANGRGMKMFPDGGKYEGEFKNDKYCGRGTYYWPDGSKFEGEFVDGRQNGKGVDYYPNGAKYVGDFKDGLPCGSGVKHYPDGGRYEGEFHNGLPSGRGVEYYSKKNVKYEGEFREGKKHGKGILYDVSGKIIYEGEFFNDNYK